MTNEISKIIFENFCREEINRNISLDKTEFITVDNEFLNHCIDDTRNRLKIKLLNGFCSKLLIEQISLHRANYGEEFGGKIEFFNASEIIDIIEKIEHKKIIGLPFQNEPLKGYLHVHHNSYSSLGYSIIRNIKEYWFNKSGEIKNIRKTDFDEIIKSYGNENISKIINAMHQKVLTCRELKGEWLIYKVKDGINYYLCLASHRETQNTRKESDEKIFNTKISKCLIEFQDLN